MDMASTVIHVVNVEMHCIIFHSIELLSLLHVIGTERWVQNLTWSGLSKFNKSWRSSMYVAPNTRQVAGYVKSYKKFSFYWILDAGHMVCCLIMVVIACDVV